MRLRTTSRRHEGTAARGGDLRSLRSPSGPNRQPLTSNLRLSTRQCCLVEFPATHSKQTTAILSTRHCFEGLATTHFRFSVSDSPSSSSIQRDNTRQALLLLTPRKQTIGVIKGCQKNGLSATCLAAFSDSNSTLKTAAKPHTLLRHKNVARVFRPEDFGAIAS